MNTINMKNHIRTLRQRLQAVLLTAAIAAAWFANGLPTAAAQGAKPFRQHVDFSLTAGPNVYTYIVDLGSLPAPPRSTTPGIGAELGGMLHYHLTPSFSVAVGPLLTLERVRVNSAGDSSDVLGTYGVDVNLQVAYTHALGSWQVCFAVGPYSHFYIWGAMHGDGATHNPYEYQIGTDANGLPQYAYTNFHSGIAAEVALLSPSHLFYQVRFSYGFTSLLNFESVDASIHPLRLSAAAGYVF